MRIEILAVGSELLTPFFQDTNSLYLTRRLNDLGLEVSRKTVVGDEWSQLLPCLREAIDRSDMVFSVGGLGPTEDDRTRGALAEVLGRKLVLRKEILRRIKERFRKRGMSMPESNKKQAFVIEGAEPLPNSHGTAPGQWLEREGKKIILLPGPLRELRPMFEEYVWPRLQGLKRRFLARRTLKITGLPESMLEDRICDLYPDDPDQRITVLASPGQVEIHLTAVSEKSEAAAGKKNRRLAQLVAERLDDFVFSEEGERLEEVVGRLLRKKRKTLAAAESCTGGLLSHRLTNIPGSSDYFLEGVVTYGNRSKVERLGVPEDLIGKYGAVSAPVSEAMALGVRKRLGADYGLAVTGIAGPTGGTPSKPVGLVFISVAGANGLETAKNLFLGGREQVKFQSTQKALDMLRRFLLLSRGKDAAARQKAERARE